MSNIIPYISAEKAVQVIKSNDRVFIHGSAATPVCLVNAMQARHQELKNVELISITNLGDVDFDSSAKSTVISSPSASAGPKHFGCISIPGRSSPLST